jgi:hypothetical protein
MISANEAVETMHQEYVKTHVSALMDCNTNFIIDYEVVQSKKQYVQGNYSGPPGNFEMIGIQRIVDRWKDNSKIIQYVHDNDGKTRRIIEQSGWNIQETLDPGHAVKAIERRVEEFHKKHGNLLAGIKGKLIGWLSFLLRARLTRSEKINLWTTAYSHYRDIHSNCIHDRKNYRKFSPWKHKRDPKVSDLLRLFLEDTVSYILKVHSDNSTQANESFNHVKTFFLNKGKKYSCSGEMRVECAILKWNYPGWKIDLRKELGIPDLDPEFQAVFDLEEKAIKKRKILEKDEEVRKKKNEKRREARKKEKIDLKSTTGYTFKKKKAEE